MVGSWIATLAPTTLSRFGFERETRSFFWNSRSSAALGEQPGGRARGPTSCFGLWRIAVKAVRFWSRRLLNMRQRQTFECCVIPETSDGLSRTRPANHGSHSYLFDESPYVGGGMQPLTDTGIDPAGNVWVANNWGTPDSRYGKGGESKSTLCGGDGLTVFYGMAKPVRAPQIGPNGPRTTSLSWWESWEPRFRHIYFSGRLRRRLRKIGTMAM
jgi:hypothetical protein